MKLNLETLKHIKFTFDIHSDHSTMCNGYRSLCRIIEEEEVKIISSNTLLADNCRFYEQDNTTAMNCKYCGKSKWMHGNGNL